MTSIEEVMLNLNIRHICLEELEIESPWREYSRESEVEFAIGKTDNLISLS